VAYATRFFEIPESWRAKKAGVEDVWSQGETLILVRLKLRLLLP
jgi:hypothetical protein